MVNNNSYHLVFAALGIPLTIFHLWADAVPVGTFAQVPGGDMSLLIKGIADLGSTFLLGWYLWYTAGKAMPKKDELHAETLKMQQLSFNTAMAEARKDYLDRLKALNDDYRNDIKEINGSLKELAKSLSFHPTPELMAAYFDAVKKQPGGS